MTIEANPSGIASMRRLALGLVLMAVVAVVGGAMVGSTVVAGIPVPGPVGIVAGLLTALPAVLILRWTSAKQGESAIWDEGETLVLNAHADPPLRVSRADIADLSAVRATSGSIQRVAFGGHMFTISSRVEVSRGVREVPVGSKYLGQDIHAVRDRVAAWLERTEDCEGC